MIESSSHGFSASSLESLLAEEESGHSVMLSYRNLNGKALAQQEGA